MNFFGWSQNKLMLVLGNIFLGVVLIVLANTGVVPLDPVNFLFFSFVAFLFALYRPGWVFLFLIGMLPYETVNLLPEGFGMMLRPYQWIAVLLSLALAVRLVMGRLSLAPLRLRWFDFCLAFVPIGAFFASLNAPSLALAFKQALVLSSFGLIYLLSRLYLRSYEDVRQVLPFFLGSSLVVFGYALWQNVRFLAGQESFQVMAGRPNATFSEADWLGLFVIVVLGVMYVLAYQTFFSKEQGSIMYHVSCIMRKMRDAKAWLMAVMLILSFVVLIITVARSAWLGAVIGAVTFAGLLLLSRRIREGMVFVGTVAVSFVIALGLVWGLHLTSFQLGNRVQSVGSGLQRITVSCGQDVALPEKIGDVSELAAFGCRHIDLEDIEAEKVAGHFVKEIVRDDPNVSIRKEIYGKVWGLIREHPLLGIGWGSAAAFLGSDERGAGLNASNMFLEIWLGSGLIGLVAFVVFWFSVIAAAVYGWFRGEENMRPLFLFVASVWAGITVFNMFNSGILLGFFFLFLALGTLMMENDRNPS